MPEMGAERINPRLARFAKALGLGWINGCSFGAGANGLSSLNTENQPP